MMVTFDRGDYWQCAFVIPKGQYDAVKARGLPALLGDVARMAPILKDGLAEVKSWDDVKLLTVAVNRLKRWTRPGLLCIGDAAHAMSPIGGVGVNLAVQDAVAAANLLAAKLADGCPSEDELDAVRRRREFAVRMMQRMQVVVQNNIVNAALKPGHQPLKPRCVMRLVTAVPWLQGHHGAVCRPWGAARACAIADSRLRPIRHRWRTSTAGGHNKKPRTMPRL